MLSAGGCFDVGLRPLGWGDSSRRGVLYVGGSAAYLVDLSDGVRVDWLALYVIR